MIKKEHLPKVGIKLLKISHVTILFLVPIIDSGLFHNYAHMCKQVALCVMQSDESATVYHHFFCKFLTFL